MSSLDPDRTSPGRAPGPATADPSGPQSSPGGPAVRVTLIGKPGCHLCDEAKTVVERVAADTGVGWQELSVLDDPELAERFGEQIPVVLVDGEQHDFWRVDEDRLRGALRGRRHWLRRR